MKRINKSAGITIVKISLITFGFLFLVYDLSAQDGEKGINEATALVKKYFATALKLLYAIGGVIGVVGAVKVYNKWSHGDQDTNKTAASWFGACLFLVVVATALKSFFGI